MGSLETLNVLTRCGLSPASRQMRCTAVWLMPTAFPIVRTLQCVALGGILVAVIVSTLSFTYFDSGLRPGSRVLSRVRPSTPSAA